MPQWLTVNQGGTADSLRSLCRGRKDFFCSEKIFQDCPYSKYREEEKNGRQKISRSHYIHGR